MTEQLHPMVPPNILLNNWKNDWFAGREHFDVLLIQVYQAGADAELDACCWWLQDRDLNVDTCKLRAARRPKPKSLKEQALIALDDAGLDAAHENILRRALEALPDD
jgi:hypothetical protein